MKFFAPVLLVILCTVSGLSQPFNRQYNNNAGTFLWSDAGNWSGGNIADDNDDIAFILGDDPDVDGFYVIKDLEVPNGRTNDQTLNGTGGLTIDLNEGGGGDFNAIRNNSAAVLDIYPDISIGNSGGGVVAAVISGNGEINFENVLTINNHTRIKTGSINFNSEISGADRVTFSSGSNAVFGSSADNNGYSGIFTVFDTNVETNTNISGGFLPSGALLRFSSSSGSVTFNGQDGMEGNIFAQPGNSNFTLFFNADHSNIGTLTMGGSGNVTLDIGSGVTNLSFANSSASAWPGTLTINNFQDLIVQFGTDNTGLTTAQLAKINIGGGPVGIDNNGYLITGCLLNDSGLTNIQCNDNGTPSDPSDDYITFELDPQGSGLGSGYTITGASVSPSGGSYGSSTTFSTASGTASSGDLNITIEDDSNSSCTLSETVTDPGTCSNACNLTSSGLTNIQCDDNGTPSDPSDDFYTFELDPQGQNLMTGYTITGASVTPSGGSYGSSTTFSTGSGTAGVGDLSITIEDNDDPSCTLGETVTDPGTCSNACNLTASGLTNIQCDDNGTPSDPSDDFYTFELDPQGQNLLTGYTITGASVTPSGGSYGSSTTFSTGSGTAGAGDLNITIEDNDDSGCTLGETVTDPGTCSNACNLTASGLTNIQCDDNGTPSDPSDDFYTFELDPQGQNLLTGYTITGASVTPSGGSYGSSTTFSTGSGTAGAGDLNITIEDNDDPGCTFSETVPDPGTCSNACNLTSSGLTNIQCDDNGTPSDPSDDFYTFELDPQGQNLMTGYTITGASVTPSGGSYGSSTTFSTGSGTAGVGDLSITIEDNDDPSCTLGETVTDPGTCSNACNLTASGLTNIQCDDNGTPSDPSDDFYTFELDPQGQNLLTGYTITGASMTPSGGSYGSSTTFSTGSGTAGAGDLSITIEDNDDSGCTLAETVTDPGTCSNACNLTSSGLTNIQCDDNGTPSDPSDDFYTFELDPQGSNLGSGYMITGGSVTPSGGSYGSSTTFSTGSGTAGAGDLSITIEDNDDSGCTFSETVTDPGTCSNACNLIASGLTNIQCDDNGTPSDPSDDFFTFELDPQGSNLGTGYTITGASVTPSGGNYGSSTTFSTGSGTAGAGDLSITIEDNDDSGCTFSETVTDPGTCSNACNLTASGLTNIQCDDNGTPSDPSDDFFTFELDPQGLNLGSGYMITGGSVSPSGGSYGSSTTFSTGSGTAGAGDLSITIEDNDDSGCTFPETVTDPGTCSNACNLTASGLMNIQCDDNGTPSDPSDDFYTFELDPQGSNLGSGYTITGASVTPSGDSYGSSTTFSTGSGTAGAGDLSITIEDNDDSGCTFPETVTDPGTCSNACNLTSSGLTNIQCDDNGTPSDPSDDFFTFELDPQGQNLLTGYTITGASVTPSGGSYGSSTTFSTGSGTAGAGDLSITIEDNDDSGCTLAETVTDPGTCSNACNLTSSGLTNIQCDDNGTPSDPSDDFYTFELDPQGSNLGSGYTITGASVTPSGDSYGSSTTFSTGSGTAGAGDLSITIEDNDDSGCTFPETVTDPGTCSNQCSINASGLTNITCDDNGTPSDNTDDFFTFVLNPSGNNLGVSYAITGAAVTPSGGSYGSATTFSTNPGSAGSGDLNITIEDDTDPSCTLSETVTDPGSCSGTCNITASGLVNIQCDDNGTPSDPSDDFYTFELDPQGSNLGTSYTITGASVTPSGGNYGSSTTFSTGSGTAGAGDLNITIEDDSDPSCTFSETVADPGSCSNTCQLNVSGLSSVTCDDNGTPSDPSDDFITFELDPTGNNPGSGYTLVGISVTPSGGNYGNSTTFSTNPGTAGGGDLNFTIEDDTDPSCTLAETLLDPGTCSGSCNIMASGISNIQCDDNGTPTDDTDDFITFELAPSGSNLGFNYDIVGISVTPSFGTYGATTTFSTDPGTAGGGDLNFTIEDDTDPSCTFSETVIDPGSCSNTCEILDSGIFNEQCDDNGTPSDPSDDFITFELDPTGNNLGSGYTLAGISVTPSGGNYGSSTVFSTDPGTAGGGDLNFDINDNSNGGCFYLEIVTDPGSCSDQCEILDSGISNIQCDDNGTPADDTDDFITFELDPFGNNLGFDYDIVGLSVTPSFGTYGTFTIFSTDPGTAGAGDLNFTIEDGDDPSCTFFETVIDPGSCSNACEILDSGIFNEQCDDNGTPSDPSDDFITFELDPTGNNLGSGYTLAGISVTPSGGNYGSSTVFSTQPGTAGDGDLNFDINDNSNGGCFYLEIVTDPGSCSDQCEILDSGISNIQCDDNGTPSDSSDDFITFELDPFGNNLGFDYDIVGLSVTPSFGTYGTFTIFSTDPGTAGGGDLNFTIEDGDDPSCTFFETVTDPGTCSNACNLTATGLTNIQCDDGGTPADPSDDFITFELAPSGVNLGASYTIVGAAVTPSGGNYGSSTTFSTSPGTGGSGDLNLTIIDDASGSCTLSETVTDPGSCSAACEILTTGLTNITCNDNGTPADASDDFFSFDLHPTGNNLGVSYTVSGAAVTPSGGNYGGATNFATAPGSAGNGDLNITVTDDSNSACSLPETVTDPGTCSGTCNLTASGLTNIQCNDDGTPSDPSDDFMTFELNPSGSNLGATYTLSGATVTPSGGNYGSSTVFMTSPGSAGAGDLNLIIEDDATSGCTFGVTVTDSGSCSGQCNLTMSGLTNIQCNDGGTPSDSSDDFITFELNPSGLNLGSSYQISGAATTPTIGNYGSTTTFSTAPGTAGAGNLNITITDAVNSTCSLSENITDPGSCSGSCDLQASGLSNVTCNDNGTPSDATDDFISFELNPSGSNLGNTYQISGAAVTPTTGSYGSSTVFTTASGTAGLGDLNLIITDDVDANCSLNETVIDPGTCSGSCNLTASGLTNIQCNDNGTPTDPSDDFFTFELNPTGGNLGTNYTLTGAVLSPSGGNYGNSTTFSTASGTAGAGDLNLAIVDGTFGSCTFGFAISDPGACSNACNLATSGLTNVTCNDNGTLSDATDDFISFELNPSGSNLGSTYQISGAAVTPTTGSYGSSTVFTTVSGTAGIGNLNLIITDNADASCSLSETVVDPGTCSGSCNLTASGLTNIQCDDNGTPTDSSDDFFTFELNPTGGNLGTNYTLIGATVTPSGGNYGNPTTFSTASGTAGAGDLSLTIVDGTFGSCTFGFAVNDPGACSNACNLATSGLTNVTCNDNGTPSDDTDDFISFELNPNGLNLGSTYQVSGAAVTPSGGNYGSGTSFSTAPGTAGLGDLNLIITDDADANCSLNETVVDPGTCSGTCNLTASGLTNIQCDDNGTPTDSSDDFFTFELNPTGSILGTGYLISGGAVTPTTGIYGSSTVFSTAPGSAGAGDLNLTITDNMSSNCTFAVTVADPGSCSGACNLAASGLVNIQCNDGGTPADPSDDFFTFELNPSGSNLGTSYQISGAAVTPSVANYGSSTVFSTAPGTAGAGDLNLIITDTDNPTCTLSETVTDPGTCSDACNLATSGLTNVTCNDNGTPSDDTDDFISFELNPSGSNLGSTYQVSGTSIIQTSGNYGSSTIFTTTPGSAGTGDVSLTITDDSDTNCSLLETIIDPGTCSGTCNITASGLMNIECNDNGTPADETDDFITFELNPTGNILGSGYSVSGTPVTPSTANYGSATVFSTQQGTAGGGDLNLIITDSDAASCIFNFALSDPGTCKDCAPFEGNISASPSICAGETVDLTFTFTGGTAPFTIRYSDGQSANDITTGAMGVFTQTVSPTETTTFMLTEITDADGCVGTPGMSATVEVFAEATGAFSDAFCEGENYTLPDGSVVSEPDVYEIILQNQSANGCDSTVTVSLTQNRSYDFSESVIVCDSDNYQWGGQTYNSTGIYTQNLQTATGCDSTLTLDLTFDGVVAFGESDAGEDADECLAEAELFGLEVSGTTGNWTSPTGATVNPADQGAAFATGLSAGENLFVWTLSTANCSAFDRDTMIVNVIGTAPILAPDNVSFEQEEAIQIQILNNDDLAGINQFTVTCFGASPEITDCDFDENDAVLNLQIDSDVVGAFEILYSICSDACPDLCDTTNVFLEIFEKRDDSDQTNYIITPANGDGLNDVLIFDDLDEYPENELIIYNRWGSVVYRAKPYDNTWDGTRNGKRLPEADYYYIMRKALPGKIEYGNVTLRY